MATKLLNCKLCNQPTKCSIECVSVICSKCTLRRTEKPCIEQKQQSKGKKKANLSAFERNKKHLDKQKELAEEHKRKQREKKCISNNNQQLYLI